MGAFLTSFVTVSLRKRIDLCMGVGAGDEVNRPRDEIGILYRRIEQINKLERETREERG
jgi:hypothetical protein